MARAYLHSIDVSPILKGVARSAPGSVMGMYRPHASVGVLEELWGCGLPPTPVKAGSDRFNSQKRRGCSACTGGDRCVSWWPPEGTLADMRLTQRLSPQLFVLDKSLSTYLDLYNLINLYLMCPIILGKFLQNTYLFQYFRLATFQKAFSSHFKFIGDMLWWDDYLLNQSQFSHYDRISEIVHLNQSQFSHYDRISEIITVFRSHLFNAVFTLLWT